MLSGLNLPDGGSCRNASLRHWACEIVTVIMLASTMNNAMGADVAWLYSYRYFQTLMQSACESADSSSGRLQYLPTAGSSGTHSHYLLHRSWHLDIQHNSKKRGTQGQFRAIMVSHEPYGAHVIVPICYTSVNTPLCRGRRHGTRELPRPMTS